MRSLMHSCQMTDCTEDYNKKMQINVLKTERDFLPAGLGHGPGLHSAHILLTVSHDSGSTGSKVK